MNKNGSAIKILIVDDCPEDRETYIRLLRSVGDRAFVFGEAESGEEGLARFQAEQPDCTFLDYNLPDLDGLEFLERIERQGGNVHPTVVMLTGQGTQTVAVEAMKRGAQDYLVKSDISTRTLLRALENTLEKAALHRRLEAGRRELEQFAESAARELRAPLGKIRHFTDFLRREYRDRLDDRAGDYLEQTHLAVARMAKLVDDLLEYAKAGVLTGPPEAVDLEAAVEEATLLLQADIEANDARIEADSLPAVSGNHGAIVRLFRHLIGNAVKFLGDHSPHIRITSHQQGSEVQIEVSDNGVGIDPADHDRLFAPLKRLRAHHEAQGSGVGLATCRKIVEALGGRIRVESTPGRGTVVHITLRGQTGDTKREACPAGETDSAPRVPTPPGI